MIIITTVDTKYFTLDSIQFARIYQPLAQGAEAIGLYNQYDTRQQLRNSTPFSEFEIDGVTYSTQAATIQALLSVIWSGVSDGDVVDLEVRVSNLEENQYSGVVVYSTFADLPVTGTLLVSYKVSNDPDSTKNGYYHWSGSVYIKDADIMLDNAILANDIDGNGYKGVNFEKGTVEGDLVVFEQLGTDYQTKDLSYFGRNNFKNNKFEDEDQFFIASGTPVIAYPIVNGRKILKVSGSGFVRGYVDLVEIEGTENISFYFLIESLTVSTGSLNFRVYVDGVEIYNDTFTTAKENEAIVIDNISGYSEGDQVDIRILPSGDAIIQLSNIYIGNAPYGKFNPEQVPLNYLQNKVSLTPNLLDIKAIEYLSSQAIEAFQYTELTIEDFDNPFTYKTIKALATNSVTLNNRVGVQLNVSELGAVGDIIDFEALFYTVSTGLDFSVRQFDSDDVFLGTGGISGDYSVSLEQNNWNNLKGKFEILTDASYIVLRVTIPNTLSCYIANLNIYKPEIKLPNLYQNRDLKFNFVNLYVDAGTGSDNNQGNELQPFATINKALLEAKKYNSIRIKVGSGTYREKVDFTVLTNSIQNIELFAETKDQVKILGSEKISTWTKTGGYTNIYQASYSTTINPNKKVIYEDGRNSMQILEDERHSNQKSLKYRLPYTKITEEAFDTSLGVTLTNMDSNPGSFYHDTGTNTIYIHATDSNNPETNGYSYEQSTQICLYSDESNENTHLKIKNVNLLFGYTYLGVFSGFKSVERFNVTGLGAANNGFEESKAYVVSYHDEVGDARDGIAGTYGDYTNTNRELPTMNYFHPWVHDNSDDGMSHHSKGNVKTIGGLSEYNGKSGYAPSNSCQWHDINSVLRYNKQNSSYSSFHEGVEVVNAVAGGDDGIGATFIGFGTESYGNRLGFAARTASTTKLVLHNAVSRNNDDYEYYAQFGKIIAINCKSTAGSAHKGTASGGTIDVITDNDLA